MDPVRDILKFSNLSSITANLSGLTGPRELFVMLIIVAVFLYGMSIGKTRALMSLLAIYVALTLTNLFPFLETLTKAVPESFEPYFIKVGLFFALYISAFFILYRSSLRRLSMGDMALTKVLLISLFQIGFIGAVMASFIPEATSEKSLGVIYPFIGTPLALFVWSLISLAILPLMKEKRSR
ncbi:MAG: hypothetical protein AAB479_02975 [Patescibacteria group bacterium]